MFELVKNYTLERHILNCACLRYTPLSLKNVDDENEQINVDLPGKDSSFSLRHKYLELEVDVKHEADKNLYVDNDCISWLNSGPIVLFSKFRLTSSSGQKIKKNWKSSGTMFCAQFLKSSKDSSDISLVLHWKLPAREQ